MFCRHFVRCPTTIKRTGIQQLIVKAEHYKENESNTQERSPSWRCLLHASLPPPSQSCECEECDKNGKSVIAAEVGDNLIKNRAEPAYGRKQKTKERERCC